MPATARKSCESNIRFIYEMLRKLDKGLILVNFYHGLCHQQYMKHLTMLDPKQLNFSLKLYERPKQVWIKITCVQYRMVTSSAFIISCCFLLFFFSFFLCQFVLSWFLFWFSISLTYLYNYTCNIGLYISHRFYKNSLCKAQCHFFSRFI